MLRISNVNWDIHVKSRCIICLGECQLGDDDREYIKGLSQRYMYYSISHLGQFEFSGKKYSGKIR